MPQCPPLRLRGDPPRPGGWSVAQDWGANPKVASRPAYLCLGHLAGGQEDDGPGHVLVQLTDVVAHDRLHGPQDHRPVRMRQLRSQSMQGGPAGGLSTQAPCRCLWRSLRDLFSMQLGTSSPVSAWTGEGAAPLSFLCGGPRDGCRLHINRGLRKGVGGWGAGLQKGRSDLCSHEEQKVGWWAPAPSVASLLVRGSCPPCSGHLSLS